MTMILHVRVTARLDEPLVTDLSTAEAGYAWLRSHWADGTIVDEPFAFPETGGYMNVAVPADDWTTAIYQLDQLLATYPLRQTIDLDIHQRIPLAEGFEKFYAAIREHRRIEARSWS